MCFRAMRRSSYYLHLAGWLASLLLAFATPLHAANELRNHPSPYLAMHGEDPVHWREWGKAVFDEARAQNKLVLVSSGYFACHWCHVMQRESYQSKEIAALINKHFLAVKIDRELLPALDAHLIDFVERTRGQAGWPLNVFLTPQGYPLLGLTYLPPQQFTEVLLNLQSRWGEDGVALDKMAKAASEQAAAMAGQANRLPAAGKGTPAQRLHEVALSYTDELQGGFGQQSKFPMTPQLLALLEVQAMSPDSALQELLLTTLDHMADRGLRDHLGGGFYRYTVDPDWQVPHYEKMLYDNALLARLYLRAGKFFDRKDYLQVAQDTLAFVERELRHVDGGYVSSLSAVDGDGVEGGYYLWEPAEVKALLSDAEWKAVREHWGWAEDVSGEARLPIPDRTAQPDPSHLTQALDTLRAHRLKRALPVDDKRLTGWNALLLSTLAEAATALPEAGYRQKGQALHDFLLAQAWDGKRMRRANEHGRALGDASLEDYAYLAAALFAWREAGFGNAATDTALVEVITAAWSRFHNEHGWRLAETDWIPISRGEPALAEGPMPSPAAVLLQVVMQAATPFNRPQWRQRATDSLESALNIVLRQPFWYASYVPLYGHFTSRDIR